MLILGSCLALNLNNSGCCVWSLSQNCSNNGCYCDQNCHILNNCCSDIADIDCYPASPSSLIFLPTTTDTLGKTNQKLHISYLYICVIKQCCIQQCTLPPTPITKLS